MKSSNSKIAIALLSDIHANLPALEAVIEDIKKRGIKHIWNAGDSIGYGPFPNETLSLLKRSKINSILGNYDKMVLNSFKNPNILPQHPQKMFAAYWTFNILSSRNKIYLAKLPERIREELFHWKILMVHGSPASDKEYLDDNTAKARLEYFAKKVDADIIISGHSHRQSYRYIQGTHFINPGSVGRSDDGSTSASYAILFVSKDRISVQHVRVPYNVSKTISALRTKKLPDVFETMFKNGINLEMAFKKNFVLKPSMSVSALKKAESAIYQILRKYSGSDFAHAEQVAKLSQLLFKGYAKLLPIYEREGVLLKYAALLHDIGWSMQDLPHHKASMLLIINENQIPISPLEKVLIALIARYHRKSEPAATDPIFRNLPAKHQKEVILLSALLRIADALDASHDSIVKDLIVKKERKNIVIFCKTSVSLPYEERRALMKKKGLLQKILKAKIYFRSIK